VSELSAILFSEIAERSTLACMLAPPPRGIPRGKQNYIFKVGKTYRASGIGPIKAGVPITIAERYKQHGYAYYRDVNGLVHREKDLSLD
jgi:hypothetical protein